MREKNCHMVSVAFVYSQYSIVFYNLRLHQLQIKVLSLVFDHLFVNEIDFHTLLKEGVQDRIILSHVSLIIMQISIYLYLL